MIERAFAPPGRVVSLFSGAGGLDLGLEKSGWRVLAQLECHLDAAATLVRQAKDAEHPAEVIARRIEDVDPRDLRDHLELAEGELELLAGGPPCQPFTTSGLRKALSDARASSLFPRYLEYVDAFSPRSILIENVDGLLSNALQHRPLSERGKAHAALAADERKGSFLHWLLCELTDRGYTTTWGVAEAADYGVPQYRQRAILMGVKGEEPCPLPSPTFGGAELPPYRTLRDALADIDELGAIQPLSKRKTEVFERIPPGGNWRNLSEEMQRETMGAAFLAEGGKSGWWRRLGWDSPTPTILGMPDHSSTALIHPDVVRCLSVNECAAAQSFPPGIVFEGGARSQYQQIGNAVPPLLGKALGTQLALANTGHKFDPPPAPAWRRTSANRRIGTHGWAMPTKSAPKFALLVKVRSDHIWASEELADSVEHITDGGATADR